MTLSVQFNPVIHVIGNFNSRADVTRDEVTQIRI